MELYHSPALLCSAVIPLLYTAALSFLGASSLFSDSFIASFFQVQTTVQLHQNMIENINLKKFNFF